MYSFKNFYIFMVLYWGNICLYALSTDKIKVLVNERPLLETAIAMMYAMIASPYWLIAGIIKVLFSKG